MIETIQEAELTPFFANREAQTAVDSFFDGTVSLLVAV